MIKILGKDARFIVKCPFRSMQLLKEWPWHRKFGKSLISAWSSFSSVSHISNYVNFRFNNGLNMSSILAGILRQFGRNSYKVFSRNCLCYVSERCVKDFNGRKKLKTVFNVFIFCVLKKGCIQALTISLQVNYFFRLISFNVFMKMEGPKTKCM